jgi:hypothetical protein
MTAARPTGLRVPARALLWIAAAAFIACAFPTSVSAITKTEATAIALAKLKPQKDEAAFVFALPKRLAPSAKVGEGHGGFERKVGKRAWLFWKDLEPYALFAHRSVLLLIDDETGRVLLRKKLWWWPLVDGKWPAFLRSSAAYSSSRFLVFSKVRPVQQPPARPVQGLLPPPIVVPEGAFAEDCLLMVGDYGYVEFDEMRAVTDFQAMEDLADRVGLRAFWTTQSATPPSPSRPLTADYPSANDLAVDIKYLVDQLNCKDVMLFIAGHGAPPNEPARLVLNFANDLTPEALHDTIAAFPQVSFKVVIESCYAGRFEPALASSPNVLVAAFSSQANQKSYFYLDYLDGFQAGQPGHRDHPNPGRAEFVNRMITGMTLLAQSAVEVDEAEARGGSFLVQMISRGFTLGSKADGASLAGYTQPILRSTAFQPRLRTLRVWHEHPMPNPGYSFVCGELEGLPFTKGTVTVRGTDLVTKGYEVSGEFELGLEGAIFFRATITKPGKYTVTVMAENGEVLAQEYTVPEPPAPGPMPCPSPGG